MSQTLDISWETIIKIFVAGFVLYVLYLVRDIAVWFFFALIISLLLDPVVKILQKLRFPRVLAVILVYLSIFGLLGLMIYMMAPVFIYEISHLVKHTPEYFEKISPLLRDLGFDVTQSFKEFTASLIDQAQESSKSIIKALSVFFGGLASTLFIFTLAFFISLEEKGPEEFLAIFTPKKYEEKVLKIFNNAQLKVAGWFGVRVLACLIVGIASFFVFFFLGVKYAFILALISGLLNFVPYIGPLITALLTLLSVGISNSWFLAVYAIIALAVIQEIENKFVTPMLTKKFLNLPPILVLMSLLIGGTIFGILGTIFVVPVFGIVYETLKEFLEKRKKEELSYQS